MKAIGHLLVLCLMILSVTAQSQTRQMNVSYPVVKKSVIKQYKLVEGRHDELFSLTDGESWNISISIPYIKESQEVPLVIALHWAGDQNCYRDYADCLAFPGFDSLYAIIVAPSADNLHWLHPSNEEKLIKLVSQIRKHWPISKGNIIITGYSNGAIGAWSYIKKYPGLFDAGILMAGTYDDARVKIPTYMIHGADDELFPFNKIKEQVDQSINRGSAIQLVRVENKSHFMACSYVAELQKAIEWYQKLK